MTDDEDDAREVTATGDALGAAASVDVVVIGAGAAGLMAALSSGRTGGRTVLVEGARQCGLKILVSGGGRCNVLPVECDEHDFHTQGSRHVLRRWLRTWPLAAVRDFFAQDLGVALVEEVGTGKLFPATQDAHTVRDALVEACRRARVEIRNDWRVTAVERVDGGYRVVSASTGATLHAACVVLATGGLSLPRTGSDGVGYTFAKALGHGLTTTYPALVPLATDDADWKELAGITLPVRWRARVAGEIRESRVRELLVTHRGFSGPAILDASHWQVRDGARIEVSWGDIAAEEWLTRLAKNGRATVVSLLAESLPRRLARLIALRAGIAETQVLSGLTRDDRQRLLAKLTHFELPIARDLGYRVAEVTGGGVPIAEVEPSTLASRASRGLYLCGEILDVTGRLGGYNFLWAWISGRLAGESAAHASRK
ncbi:MAG: NAD(P)/FAD-dependent oxidoreductase [Planctomycetota bacterium]